MNYKKYFTGYVLLLTMFLAISSLSGCGSGGGGENIAGDNSNEETSTLQQNSIVLQKTWVKTYGSIDWEWAVSIQQTSDGGYILAGSTDSSDDNGDILVIKLDWRGDVLWQKSYGGEGWEWVSNILQTSDGGYILAGSTDTSDSNGDIWVIKLDDSGKISWQKSYSHEGLEWPSSIQIISDGGYIVTGSASDPLDGHTNTLVMKLGQNGDVAWEKTYAGNGLEWPSSIQQTIDGGYVVAGSASDPADGTSDTWIIKLDEHGEMQWQKSYAGEGSEWPSSIRQSNDMGYIIAGFASDSSGGNGDLWVMKLDGNGVISWQRAYGGDGWDSASSVHQTSDGGYIVAGSTSDLSGDYGDALVVKFAENGDVEWQKSFGGKGLEGASTIQQTLDGGYIVAGFTDSFGAGNEDILVLKLDADGNMDGCMLGMDISQVSSISSADTYVIPNDTSVVTEPAITNVLDTNINSADSSATPVTWCTGSSGAGKQTYTLSVNKAINGVVTSDPAGINCGYEDDGSNGLIWRGDCTHLYSEETVVTLTASPSSRSSFSGWSVDDVCIDGHVTMGADKSCTATFSSRYRLDYVSGDNQNWGGGVMPSPMIFKIFDKTTGTYVENGFEGLIMSAESDTGYSDGDWCWGCSPDINSTNVASEAGAYWYVELCQPLPPYELYIYVNAIDSYTGEHIEDSPYLMHHTISGDDAYCDG